MNLPSLIAVRGFRSRKEITARFHGRVNSTMFMGCLPRSLLMLVRKCIWDEPSQSFHVQIQPVISRQGWIGHVRDQDRSLETVVMFPEVDLNEMLQDADILEVVSQ